MSAKTNRREFLSVCAAGALNAAKRVQVAAHPWVYAATQPNYDIGPILDGIFADFKYAGIDAIELIHTALRPPGAVERIGNLSHKHNLPVIGMSFDRLMWDRSQHPAILDEAHVGIERLGKLGGRTLGASVGYKKERKTPGELDAQAECLRQIVKICENNRVVLNLHNHVYEVRDGEYDLNGTLARIPAVKVGPDLGWLFRAKIDPVDFIKRHANQLVYMHLRNEKADGKWPEDLTEGVIDYAAVGRILHQIHYSGDMAIELAHEKDFRTTRPLRESLKASREYVRKAIGY